MKKVKKTLIMVCLMSGLVLPMGVQASTTNSKDIRSSAMDVFPNLEKEQKARGYTERVFSKDTYLKCTPKETTKESMKKDKQQLTKTKYTQDDFIITEVPESEYKIAEARQKSLKLAPSIQYGYSEEDFYNFNEMSSPDSFFHMGMILYRNPSDRYKFLARNEFCWTGQPIFTIVDGAGISIGDGMKIYTNTYSGQINHTQPVLDNSSPTGISYKSTTLDVTGIIHNPFGVAAKYDIWGGTEDMGYLECEVGFSQYNGVRQESNVYANYAHAQVGLMGTLSLSDSGGISLGIGMKQQDFSLACDSSVN